MEGKKSPSEIAGYLVLVAIILFAVIEAASVLGFTVLILAGAIALQQLGVADEIIIIAFGLCGRDVASRELSKWIDDLKR